MRLVLVGIACLGFVVGCGGDTPSSAPGQGAGAVAAPTTGGKAAPKGRDKAHRGQKDFNRVDTTRQD